MVGRLVFALGLGLTLVAGCSSNETASSGCRGDADCKSDETCQQGSCVKLTADAGADTGADSPAETSATCIGMQPGPTSGGPCGCATDCGAPEICLDETSTGTPGGRCLRGCPTGSCPGDQLCLQATPGQPGTESCFRKCVTNSECPSSQICQTLESGGELICSPFCQSDADCPAIGKCDPYSGLCLASPVYKGSKETGDACAEDTECKSQFCITGVAKFPEGYCTAFCSLEKQGCPDGSHCMPIWSSVGDTGLCLNKCTTETECRSGYGCVGTSQFPGVKVCGPP